MTFTIAEKILGRIPAARRYWLKRIDAALHGAYRAGLIDSFTLHAIDARAKYVFDHLLSEPMNTDRASGSMCTPAPSAREPNREETKP